MKYSDENVYKLCLLCQFSMCRCSCDTSMQTTPKVIVPGSQIGEVLARHSISIVKSFHVDNVVYQEVVNNSLFNAKQIKKNSPLL